MKTKVLNIRVPEGYEIDKENSTLERIVFKEKEKPWDANGKYIDGFRYASNGTIEAHHHYRALYDINVFATKKEVRAALAMAQISLILKYDKRYGGRVTEEEFDGVNMRYIIKAYERQIVIGRSLYFHYYLAFHTKEQAELFLQEHEDLVKRYYMIYDELI